MTQYWDEGDIIFADFPYEGEPHIKAKRPCLVLKVTDDAIIAAKITTTQLNLHKSHKLNQGFADCSKGFIKFSSWINLHRIEKIPFEDCHRHLATLKDSVLADIMSKIK